MTIDFMIVYLNEVNNYTFLNKIIEINGKWTNKKYKKYLNSVYCSSTTNMDYCSGWVKLDISLHVFGTCKVKLSHFIFLILSSRVRSSHLYIYNRKYE